MKILLIHPHDIYSLLEPWTVRIINIAGELKKSGHEVKLIYFPLNWQKNIRASEFGGITAVPLSRRSGPASLIRNIAAIYKISRPFDIIHFQKCFHWASIPALLAALFQGKPVHYDWDDWEEKIFIASNEKPFLPVRALIQILEKCLPKLADTISVSSSGLKRICRSLNVEEKRIFLVPVGANLGKFNPAAASGSFKKEYGINGPLIFYHGQLHSAQYASLFIDVAARFQDERPDVSFMLVGDGDKLNALKLYARKLGLRNLIFTGAVAHDDIPQYIACADICVAPFEDNAITRCKSPLKLVEYLASGKPIVASAAGEANEMLAAGAGILAKPADIDSLAGGIRKLLNDVGLRQSLAEAGRKRAEEKYNWKISAANLEQAYHMAIAVNSRKSFRIFSRHYYKLKEYFRDGGLPYVFYRALKYGVFLARQKRLIGQKAGDVAIQSDNIKLSVTENCARLFYDNIELTKDVGLHTAFYYNGRWYDSSRAGLRAKKISEREMEIGVEWGEIPVAQKWSIKIAGQQSLFWEADIKVNRRISLQQYKAGLMLSEYYDRWFNSYEEGRFSCDPVAWKEIFLEDRESRAFGVRDSNGGGRYRPAVFFEIFSKANPLIQSTGQLIKARILQAQVKARQEDIVFTPGTYKYFSGKIKLAENGEVDSYINYSKPRQNKYFSGIMKEIENDFASDNMEGKECIYIYGDFEELHDRIAGVRGEFNEKIRRIKESAGAGIKIKIGISRYNFFRLHKVLEFCSSLAGQQVKVEGISLDIFPLEQLLNNFAVYLGRLKSIKPDQIQFIFNDKELFALLTAVSSQANQDNERELLRLLGVISEYAFIGPKTVVLDTFHRCNAACLHCWVHTPKIRHTQEFLDRKLDFGLYKGIINDFSQLRVDNIIFQGDGEPLMHDQIFEMIEYARNKNIKVSFFTNGIILDKDKAKKAINLGVNEIYCSLPAGSSKTYSVINPKQGGDTFYAVTENLKRLIFLRRQMGKERPVLKMTHVIHTLNYHELMRMAENDAEIGADAVRFYIIRVDDNVRFLKLKPEEVEAIRRALPDVKEYLKSRKIQLLDTTDFQLQHYEEKTGSWSKRVFLDGGCLIGWYFCLIPAKGDISLCCHLRTVGNLSEKSFRQIWDSRDYWRWRVQAKYLKDNINVAFLNGVKLYTEHCEHCDTHQVLRDVRQELRKYNLERFLNIS